MTSISLLNHPGIELQAIGGTAAEVEEAQRQAYLENPDDFFGPPPGLTPSPSSSSNMHLDAEDDMLIPPNSPPPLPHPVEEPLMMAPPESPLPSYSPAPPSYQVDSPASVDRPLTPDSTQVDENNLPYSPTHPHSNSSLEESEGYPAQPGVRPDEAWFSNTGRDSYNIDADLDGVQSRAQFIQVIPGLERHIIRGSHGRGCDTHAQRLFAQKDPYPRPMLTKKQRYTFAANQPHTPIVNAALEQERDFTLLAEVYAFHKADEKMKRLSRELGQLKQQFQVAQLHRNDSIWNLAAANAYQWVAPHVIYDQWPGPSLTADHIQQGLEVWNDPWKEQASPAQANCEWCGKSGHEAWECSFLTECQNCHNPGHEDWFCKRPHTNCEEDYPCFIPEDHYNCNDPSRHPYFFLSKSSCRLP